MSRSISNAYHLVVSTRELQSPTDLVAFLSKHSQKYIVSVEYGKNSHPHLDAFFILPKEVRQDKMREKIVKNLYTHVDTKERINIKLVVNSIDPDERYGFGYSFKENPRQYYSNQSKEYLDKCVDYYMKAKDRVKMTLDKFKDKVIDVRTIGDMFLQFVIDQNTKSRNDRVSKPTVDSYTWKYFMLMIDVDIPFDVYQRINVEKMVEWCSQRYERFIRLDNEQNEFDDDL